MCLILKHTSLAQYGMSHLAKGMVVPVIGSLVVAFSLLCMAKEFTSLLAFQCGDCFNCCCHSYIIFRISIIMLTVIAKGEQRLLHASCLIALPAFGCKDTTFIVKKKKSWELFGFRRTLGCGFVFYFSFSKVMPS